MRWLLLAALGVGLSQPSAPPVQSVDLAVPVPPVYFRQDSAAQLVYELHITNFLQTDVSLAAVTARDGNGIVLAHYDDAELRRRITRPGLRNDHATPHLIGPGMRAIVNVWIAVPPASGFVRSVTHAVELDVIRPAETIRARASGGAASTDFSPVPELDAPLRGGPWIAIYDPLLKGGHRTAIYTLDGRARIPGRFRHRLHRPPAGRRPAGGAAADSNGFGADVLAVADGTVTIAVDGVPDATPPPISLERPAAITSRSTWADGRFAFYEHLQMGSVKVKAGDTVTRGQVIARLGSSGSSSIGPHLHFHVSDASATLAAEGMPFVFRQFTQVGRFDSLTALTSGAKWLPAGSADIRRLERPDPVTVIHFP